MNMPPTLSRPTCEAVALLLAATHGATCLSSAVTNARLGTTLLHAHACSACCIVISSCLVYTLWCGFASVHDLGLARHVLWECKAGLAAKAICTVLVSLWQQQAGIRGSQ
jgi:hypothetical protein